MCKEWPAFTKWASVEQNTKVFWKENKGISYIVNDLIGKDEKITANNLYLYPNKKQANIYSFRKANEYKVKMEEFVESMMHEYMPGTYSLKLELKNIGNILGNYVD